MRKMWMWDPREDPGAEEVVGRDGCQQAPKVRIAIRCIAFLRMDLKAAKEADAAAKKADEAAKKAEVALKTAQQQIRCAAISDHSIA